MQHVTDVCLHIFGSIFQVPEIHFNGFVLEYSSGWFSEHIAQLPVDWLLTGFGVFEGKLHVAGRFADDIHGRPFAFGNPFEQSDIPGVHDQSHALLRLVSDDLLLREGGVTHGKQGCVDFATGTFDQLGEAVEMATGTMVVHGDDRVVVAFGEGAEGVKDTLLHFRVGALHGIQLNGILEFAGSHRGDCATPHADAVVVAAQQDDLVALDRLILHAVAAVTETDTPGEHDDLVVSVFFVILEVFESEHRSRDERLPEFVSEVAGPVGRLDQDLFGGLVKPGARFGVVFPGTVVVGTRIGRHIDRRSGDGDAALAPGDAVAYFAPCACGGPVKRLYGGGEVMGFGLQ